MSYTYICTLCVKDECSSSGGSMASDDGSSCDSGGLPETFYQPMETAGGEWAPANEVVCGHQFTSSLPHQV